LLINTQANVGIIEQTNNSLAQKESQANRLLPIKESDFYYF